MAFSCSIPDWLSNMRDGHNPPVAKYIDDKKFEPMHFAMGCQTIPWGYKLSPEGLTLQTKCQERYDAGQAKTHFKYWAMDRLSSGSVPGLEGEPASMCSNQNISLLSLRQAKTSVVKMFAPDNRWALTASGSLYSLGEKVYSDQFKELLEQKKVAQDDTYVEKLHEEARARAADTDTAATGELEPPMRPVLVVNPVERRVEMAVVSDRPDAPVWADSPCE